MIKSKLIGSIIIAYFCTYRQLFAQDNNDEPTFFTGLSPVILHQNEAEIYFTNSLTSYWNVQKQYDPDFATGIFVDRKRYTKAEHTLRGSYGFAKNKKWDLGLEVKFAEARLDEAARSSPLRVFGNDSTGGKSYRNFTAIGLRLRASPFKNIPELTLQGTIYYPQSSHSSTETELILLDAQNVKTVLTATYYLKSGEYLNFFFQGDWLTTFKSGYSDRTVHSPNLSSLAVVRIGGGHWNIFGGLNYGMDFRQFSTGSLYLWDQHLFGSGGVFYQPTPVFSVVLSGQIPLFYQSTLPYVEFVRESYLGFSLGIRSLLNSVKK